MQQNNTMNARMPSTIQIVRPTPRLGGVAATVGKPADAGGGDELLAALFQTSVEAVQAGETRGTVLAGASARAASGSEGGSAVAACCGGAADDASGTTSASDWLKALGASLSRAPQFQQ